MIVSAIIAPTRGQPTWPLAQYTNWFVQLAKSGAFVRLFVDPSIYETVQPWLQWATIDVIPMSMPELPLWKEYGAAGAQLPAFRNEQKDTQEYMLLMNSKTDLMVQAGNTGRLTWVDAGIARILSDPGLAFTRLREIDEMPVDELAPVTIPGPQDKQPVNFDHVQWRFGGGFFTGGAAAINMFNTACLQKLRSIKPRLTWEVNIWNALEQDGFPIKWVYGDHNDSFWENVK